MQTTSKMIHAAKDKFKYFEGEPFRKFQEESIQFILESEKRFVILEAPTGSGKSLIAMTVGQAAGGMTYMVHSKMLQNQITESFPEAKSLFGRSNYQCLSNPELTCADCTHTRRYPCIHKRTDCIYKTEKSLLLTSKLKILNYDYYLTEVNYVGRLQDQPFLVIDEADNLENTMISFMTLVFTKYALGRLGIGVPARKTADSSMGIRPWIEFAEMAKYRAQSVYGKIGREIESYGEINQDFQVRRIKEYERIGQLLAKIILFLDNVDESWMYQETDGGGISFRPLWITEKMADKFMWGHGAVGCKWVLMSASFLPPEILAKTLGIPSGEMDYYCTQSTFDPEKRPIHVENTANLTNKTMAEETPKVIRRVKEILDAHPDERGLIHCVSYKLGEALMAGLKGTKYEVRLIVHDSKNKQEMFDEFVSGNGCDKVMLSPSMERGVSLDYDLCRFIIILKAPYAYLGDKIVSTRVYSGSIGQRWYTAQMLLTALQMSGRAMRAEDDYCVTYILDSNFSRTLSKNARMLPLWWREAIV